MLRGYFRGAALLGVAEVLLRLRALILIPVLTKAFGAVDYGIWSQVAVIVSLVMPLIVFCTDSGMMRFLPGRSSSEIRQGFSSLLIYYFFASGIIAGLLWIFAVPISAQFFESAENAHFVKICGLAAFVGVMSNACRNYYRVISRPGIYATINIVQATYVTIISVWVVMSAGSVFDVVLATLTADLILAFCLMLHIRPFRSMKIDWVFLKRLLSFGAPLIPSAYAMWGLNVSDRLFIAHYGVMTDLGVYSVVYSLGYVLIALFFNPIWLMFPSAAAELYNKNRLVELSQLFYQSSRLALGILVPAIVGIAVLGDPVLRLLSTEEFVRGAPLIPLITLGYALHMLSSYFDVMLGLAGRQIWSTVAIGFAAATNISLNFILVPTLGITGAAYATAIGFGVQFGVATLQGVKHVKLQFHWIFLLKAVIASMLMGIFVSQLSVTGAMDLVLAVIGGVFFYCAAMIAFRAVASSEWSDVLQVTGLSRVSVIARFSAYCGFKGKN